MQDSQAKIVKYWSLEAPKVMPARKAINFLRALIINENMMHRIAIARIKPKPSRIRFDCEYS